MTDGSRRKELTAQYKQNLPEAGVYTITNRENGKVFLGSSPNLLSVRSKLAFGRSTNAPGVLDHKLKQDALQYGMEAFELQVLEVLEIRPEMSAADVKADLATMEALWREKLDPASMY